MSRSQLAFKRIVDATVATAGLLLLSPLVLLVAVAVRIDSRGPVFFRQRRLGRGANQFRIWKFRTMRADADVRVDDGGNVVNVAKDPRHTRVGRFLRRFSLDELPQLANVIAGDMSLIGPRPDLPEALALYTPAERRKLDVKPGITGLAQASGRNALSAHEKWELDARYASDASIGLDLRILWMTVGAVLGRRGIYRANSGHDEGKR